MKHLIEDFGKPIKKVNPILKEFKTFAMRGNVIDLAVGVIIGAAFGKIVDSLVKDIIMPPLGLVIGRVDFKDLYWNLSDKSYENLEAATKAAAPVIRYGLFLNNIISFVIVAFAVFLLVRLINRLNAKPEPIAPAAPNTKECPFCFSTVSLKATRCPQCTSQL